MEYVNLGSSGLKVSRICLGMMTYGSPKWRPWVLDRAASRPFIKRAIEAGINFFDTANLYSNGLSEVLSGKLLKEYAKRDEIIIATKVYFHVSDDITADAASVNASAIPPNTSGLSRKHIFAAVDASLKRLGTDYIDLYQIHRWDPSTPIEETMEALNDLVRSGKVRYIGASSMWAWQFAKAQQIAREHNWSRFISMQNHYNLAYREEEREMIPLCNISPVIRVADCNIGPISRVQKSFRHLSFTLFVSLIVPSLSARTIKFLSTFASAVSIIICILYFVFISLYCKNKFFSTFLYKI